MQFVLMCTIPMTRNNEGNGAGKTADAAPEKMAQHHARWIEDMAIRLLCVCALDHFGDFVTDEVVAPVRANFSQYTKVFFFVVNSSTLP